MTADREMAPRSRYVALNGAYVRILEYGDLRAEPVLALHSAGLNGDEFNEFALNLLTHGRYRLISLDYRGHGPSAVDTRVSLAEIANDVLTLIELLGLDGVHLIGHSVGGVIAGLSAAQCQTRMRSVTIVSSPPEGQPVFLERAKEARATGMKTIVGPTLARWFSKPELQAKGPAVRYAEFTLRRTPLETWSSLWESFAEFEGFVALREIPLLCISGESDQSTPPAVVERTRITLNGDTPLQVLPGGSHQIFLTHPAIVAEVWDDWVSNGFVL